MLLFGRSYRGYDFEVLCKDIGRAFHGDWHVIKVLLGVFVYTILIQEVVKRFGGDRLLHALYENEHIFSLVSEKRLYCTDISSP